MGALGAIDIPNRNVDDFRATLRDREAKLANARKQRDTILLDLRKANEAVDMGDRQARLRLPDLNKAATAVGRLILSIQREVSESRGQLALATNQAAAAAAKRAELEAAALPRDKWFECVCPDGIRKVRHRAASFEALRKALQPGYSIVGQVFGHNEDGAGGFVSTPGAPSMLKALLDSQGDELLVWLAKHGIIGSDKPVVALPRNGREVVQ
jgi:hypothetical protein